MTPPAPGDRVVLITGASSGIGRESALRFARAGDTVVGVARHEAGLREVAAEAPDIDGADLDGADLDGSGIQVEVCDLDEADERAALVARVLARYGRVDVLVNNAGVGAIGLLHELSGEDVERVYRTNVIAYADLARLVLPQMLERGSGVLVLLSSAAAWVSGPPSTVYSSSKFAVDGLVEGLRRETSGTGVLVHSVNPGPIATPYLSRTAERPPQPGDPPVPDAPGFPASWVADAVFEVAQAGHPVTRSVPRPVGLLRLAQVPPVGFVLDVVLGRLAGPVVRIAREAVAARVQGIPRR